MTGLLLAIETSTPTTRVALVDADGRCVERAEDASTRHSSSLLHLCDGVLRRAGSGLRDLAAIACGAGPGSFTGLRVGLAAAKGLCLPTEIPLLLVSSLEALAMDVARAAASEHVAACIDAGKGEIYVAFYGVSEGKPTPRSPEWLVRPNAITAPPGGGSFVAGGPGADRHAASIEAAGIGVRRGVAGPTAESVGGFARLRLVRGERDDLSSAVPRYGRPPDITTPSIKTGSSRRT